MVRRTSLPLVALASSLLAAADQGAGSAAQDRWDPERYVVRVPRLMTPPRMDGDLSGWKSVAFTDGLWDLARVRLPLGSTRPSTA
jgi:hypothetical protein